MSFHLKSTKEVWLVTLSPPTHLQEKEHHKSFVLRTHTNVLQYYHGSFFLLLLDSRNIPASCLKPVVCFLSGFAMITSCCTIMFRWVAVLGVTCSTVVTTPVLHYSSCARGQKWQSGPQHLLLVITQKDKSVIVTCTSRTETADAASTTSALCKLQYRERANAKLAKNPK